MVEDFLNNQEVEKDNRAFLPFCLFQQLKPHLEANINNIYAQECGLWIDKYQVGSVESIVLQNTMVCHQLLTSRHLDLNVVTIGIWTTIFKASAYAEMFEERTGTPIEQIVILVVTEDGQVQEFIKKKHEYLPLLVETIEQFVSEWENENEENSDGGVTAVAV